VSHIEGLTIRNEGDVCARLGQAFEDYVGQYVASHKSAALAG
jgi:hypothetical protein